MKGARNSKGFTLIEVILFLAITGLMLTGVLIGVSGVVNTQRYDETVESVFDYMQGQYNLVDNVRNNRPANLDCSSTQPAVQNMSANNPRGTTECTIVGRLLASTNGRDITSSPVYAREPVATVTATNETDLLNALGIAKLDASLNQDEEEYAVPWQAQIYTNPLLPSASNEFAILILRLPTNGLTRTYVADSVPGTLSTMWDPPSASDINLCINQQGLTTNPARGVRVVQGASNSNGVRLISPGDGVC